MEFKRSVAYRMVIRHRRVPVWLFWAAFPGWFIILTFVLAFWVLGEYCR